MIVYICLCIFYDRVLILWTQLGNNVWTQFEFDGVVCWAKLCSIVFTAFAVYMMRWLKPGNFTKINTPPWVFFTFCKLYKWYRMAQSVTYNIDHYPSSPSAKDSWHGTEISSTQYLESKTGGIKHCSVQFGETASKVLQPLQNVPPWRCYLTGCRTIVGTII